MKTLKIFFLFALILTSNFISKSFSATPPDEGMWLPLWIEKLNYEDMKRLGLKLTPEQIFSVNNSSVKDAIVGLGQKDNGVDMFFCTGEIVSPKGLILTNHHCAYDAVQTLSSVDADYLTNGFWAYRLEEELPIPNMTISHLLRIEDVTKRVLEGVTNETSESQRKQMTTKAIRQIEKEASENKKYNVHVKPFFDGSEYYLFVYETFRDIRLVGVPPSSIGKFGGDTDNWMWPRHTGDFSYLRVYSAPDGSPADYSPQNIPLVPKHFLPVSVKGVEKNDFTMIFGFPGSTDRYLTSYGVDFDVQYSNPTIVSIRDKKLEIMKKYMDMDSKTRIQYASKYAQTANYWKYYIGQTKQLKLHNISQRKRELENNFMKWVNSDPERQKRYSNVLTDIEKGYKDLTSVIVLLKYLEEGVFQGPEFIYFSFGAFQLNGILSQQNEAKGKEKAKFDADIKSLAEDFAGKLKDHFKDYNANVDKELFITLIKMMYSNVDKANHPDIFAKAMKKYKNSFEKWADDIFAKSIFVNEDRLNAFLKKPSFSVLSKDPGWAVTMSMVNSIRSAYGVYNDVEAKTDKANRLFVEGLRLMQPEKKFYPNANSTMRMTYGQVLDYIPADAVHYDFKTTMQGIIEKEDPKNEEFIVDGKLKSLIQAKDFGMYGSKDGLPVCFISNNDITGGNSGSPVMNAEGQLIGIAFDGNWESMSGDIQFEPSVQRTICVDIRYVLFVTDKLAGAKNLIDEMKIVR